MKTKCYPKVPLGNYIQQHFERNDNFIYGVDSAVGVNIDKEMGKMRANIDPSKIDDFFLVKPGYFVFNQRGSRKLGLGYNSTESTYITTYDHVVFSVKDSEQLDPLYLYLYLSRKEWDRYAEYVSWGSSTEYFRWKNLCETVIILPPIENQRRVVNAWKALQEIKEQNEATATPLMQVCQSYLQEIKHNYSHVTLDSYIEANDVRNNDNAFGVDELRGVTSDGIFDNSKASTDGLKFGNYKVVNKGDFAYNPSRINLGSIAKCEMDNCIISPMYIVFRLSQKGRELLLPDYLNLWFRRKEFQRSTLFYAAGSVRDTFDFNAMRNTRIPIPPIDIQNAVVNLYNCAKEAKSIAEEADRKSREICPALIQYAIHN